jgi:hypothetical protein
MTDYDAIYHQIFGRPELVAALLRDFAPARWLDGHDLDRKALSNAKFHAEIGARREGDVIWQIPPRDGGDTYLLLLLEFQSSSDRWMALRAMVYASLLWQHLFNEKLILPDGRLPPVLPIVLHRGKPGWAAPLAVRDLIGLGEGSSLWQFQPDMRYYVIDEVNFDEADLEQRAGWVPLLFRAEIASNPGRLVAVADALMAEFAHNPAFAGLKRAFMQLLTGASSNRDSNMFLNSNKLSGSRTPGSKGPIADMLGIAPGLIGNDHIEQRRDGDLRFMSQSVAIPAPKALKSFCINGRGVFCEAEGQPPVATRPSPVRYRA